jgi:hypothetical protein
MTPCCTNSIIHLPKQGNSSWKLSILHIPLGHGTVRTPIIPTGITVGSSSQALSHGKLSSFVMVSLIAHQVFLTKQTVHLDAERIIVCIGIRERWQVCWRGRETKDSPLTESSNHKIVGANEKKTYILHQYTSLLTDDWTYWDDIEEANR